MMWIDRKKEPLPDSGTLIVSVTVRMAADLHMPSCFTTTVQGSEYGPLDSYGDNYMYAAEITHWQRLPAPVKPFEYN